jgi:hypothetical protein
LFKSCESAIPGTTTIAIAIGTPLTILRLGGLFDDFALSRAAVSAISERARA